MRISPLSERSQGDSALADWIREHGERRDHRVWLKLERAGIEKPGFGVPDTDQNDQVVSDIRNLFLMAPTDCSKLLSAMTDGHFFDKRGGHGSNQSAVVELECYLRTDW